MNVFENEVISIVIEKLTEFVQEKDARLLNGQKSFHNENSEFPKANSNALISQVKDLTGSTSNGVKLIHKCDYCSYSSQNRHYLKQHVDLVHTANRPFKCPFCDYAGKRGFSLKEHLIVHSNERPYQCCECTASFHKKGHLTNHAKMHFGKPSESLNTYEQLNLLKTEGSIFLCNNCDFETNSHDAYLNHLNTHPDGKIYACSLCDFLTVHLNILIEHMQSHNSSAKILLKCSECGFICSITDELRQHMLQHVQLDNLIDSKSNELSTSKILQDNMDISNAGTNEQLVYKFVNKTSENSSVIDNVISYQESHIPYNNTCRKFQKIYRCTICGYTSEYQRTIKAHVWKHSGHKNVDYPMFECTTLNHELDSKFSNFSTNKKSPNLKTVTETLQESSKVAESNEVNMAFDDYSALIKLLQNLPDKRKLVENFSSTLDFKTDFIKKKSFFLSNDIVDNERLQNKSAKHTFEDSGEWNHSKKQCTLSTSKTSTEDNSSQKNSKLLETLINSFQNNSPKICQVPKEAIVNESKSSSSTCQLQSIPNFEPPKLGISSSLLSVVEIFHNDSEKEEKEAKAKDAKNASKNKSKNLLNISKDDIAMEIMDQVEILEHPLGFYRCKLCHYKSSVKGHIRQHMRVHKSKKPFECPLCDFLGDSQLALQEHSIQHCKLRTYQCKCCSSVFNYKSQLRTHSRIHEQQQLQQLLAIPEEVKGKLDLINNEKNILSNEQLFNKNELSQSKDFYNGEVNEKLLKCEQCDFLASSSRSLKSHMKRHVNDQRYLHQPLEQYKCRLCGYVCHYLPSMKSHMWRHVGDENYSYTLTQEAIIDTHPDESSNDDQEKVGYEIRQGKCKDLDKSLVIYCCHSCGFESADHLVFTEHLKAHDIPAKVNDLVPVSSQA